MGTANVAVKIVNYLLSVIEISCISDRITGFHPIAINCTHLQKGIDIELKG